ncbi:sigma-70 family RNA polymerase sigma factor [Methylobacterium sp.]|uniref:sigma-70 family RNA polymerase sigma factor n=1 Tax=Methylobacterium sp. TaxID=409 RepID=UPI0025E1633D|nr:sigma-70 family RNA polymerase sigma factor [Methylobacterium sp.]
MPWTPSERVTELLAQLEDALARGGDAQLAAEIRVGLQENMTLLHRFALSLTKNPGRAEDLVQDTLLRAWKYRHQFVSGTNLPAWLSVIMRNTFYSNQRKRSHEVEDGDGSYAAQLVSLPAQGGSLDLQDMKAAIARLPPEMGRTLTLVAIDNLSYEEAATVMGCKIGTVKSRLWRARERLAETLGYTADDIGPDKLARSALSQDGDSIRAG